MYNKKILKLKFRPREILLLAIVCLLISAIICGVFALKITNIYGGAMYAGKSSRLNKALLYGQQSATEEKGAIVFFGDSITEMYDLNKYYPDKHYVNRGIGGDLTTDLTARAESNVIALEPATIVLLVGTNDLNTRTVEDTSASFRILIELLTDKLPDTKIIVQSVLPVCRLSFAFSHIMVSDRNNDKINALNHEIRKLCDEFNLVYANTSAALMKNGELNPNYALDGLHINETGYAVITGVIKTFLDVELN